MKMPSDKAYKLPTGVVIFTLMMTALVAYLCVKSLQGRMKSAWPW